MSVDPVTTEKGEPATSCDSKRDVSRENTPEYLDSEIDDWNWDELEAFPSKSDTIPTQSQKITALHNSLGDPEAHGREITARRIPRPIADHPLSMSVDPVTREKDEPVTSCDSKREKPRANTLEYLDSEIDDWN